MSDELAVLLVRMLGPSEADRGLAIKAAAKRPLGDQRTIVQALFERSRQTDEVSPIVWATVKVSVGSITDQSAVMSRSSAGGRTPPATAEP